MPKPKTPKEVKTQWEGDLKRWDTLINNASRDPELQDSLRIHQATLRGELNYLKENGKVSGRGQAVVGELTKQLKDAEKGQAGGSSLSKHPIIPQFSRGQFRHYGAAFLKAMHGVTIPAV